MDSVRNDGAKDVRLLETDFSQTVKSIERDEVRQSIVQKTREETNVSTGTIETDKTDAAEDTGLLETDFSQTELQLQILESCTSQSLAELQLQTSELSTRQTSAASVVLRRGHKILVDFLDPYSILDRFNADSFIPLRDIRDIAEMKNTTEKNNGILKKIRSKGDHGFTSFKSYLSQTEQNLLLSCLNGLEQGGNIEAFIKQLESQAKDKMSKALQEQPMKQGVIEDKGGVIMCYRNTYMVLPSYYCFTHHICCCTMCTEHSGCPCFKEVKSDRAHVKEIKEERLELQNRWDFDVKVPEDNTTCNIVYFCLLEDGTFLLADSANKRLKKLNRSYRVIDHVDMHDDPRHLCAIGKGRVVLTTRPSKVRSKPQIYVIETKYKLRVDMSTELPCDFARTAYHNETIYMSTIEGIFAYNTDLKRKTIFEESRDLFQSSVVPIAISDSGENIYVSDHLKIFTFDRNGCLLATSESTYKFITDVFPFNESSILVADTIAKELVIDDFKKNQTKIHIPKVVDIATVYFNRKSSSVLIGVSDSDCILVFSLPTSVLQD